MQLLKTGIDSSPFKEIMYISNNVKMSNVLRNASESRDHTKHLLVKLSSDVLELYDHYVINSLFIF